MQLKSLTDAVIALKGKMIILLEALIAHKGKRYLLQVIFILRMWKTKRVYASYLDKKVNKLAI